MLLGDRKKGKRDEGPRLLDAALGEAGSSVYVLVRARDVYPVHISANFERVFLLPPERLEDDIEALNRLLTFESRMDVRRAVEAWDRRAPLVTNFSFTPDGLAEPRPMRCTITPVQGDAYYLVTFDDTAHEEARVAELERQLHGLSSDAQIKADFLNQMSHEIRTPLNGIIGMLALSRDHLNDPAEVADELDKVEELGRYLLSLVNDILDMSRIEAGKVELERRPFSLDAFADELRTLFAKNALDRGITYTVSIEDCETRALLGDRLRLSQVIVNLVSNALKFTPAGGTVAVTFKEMYRAGDTVRLMARVRDTGKGMDPQFLGRLFRPFEQEDASIAQQYGGSGLGMAIADSLVSLMGGEIVVDSEVGKGTEFALYLPFGVARPEDVPKDEPRMAAPEAKLGRVRSAPAANVTAASATASVGAQAAPATASVGAPVEPVPASSAPTTPAASAPKPAPAPSASESLFAGLRVLMAEDNDVNAKITSSVLAKRGALVERARDGQEAVDMFAAHERGYYDVILTDIKMPVLDGWGAAQCIREIEGDAPEKVILIALSANAYVEDARRSREIGMDGHVGKPIDFDELESVVASLIARTRRGTEKGTS